MALRRNSKTLISNIMLRKQKIKCKGFVMYYASVKIWILIEMLVPDSHKLLREPGYAPHMSVSLCFTLHMFHTFHTLTLLWQMSQIKNSICLPLVLMEGRFKGSLSDKQHALISALSVILWKHVVHSMSFTYANINMTAAESSLCSLRGALLNSWSFGCVYTIFYPRETDVH